LGSFDVELIERVNQRVQVFKSILQDIENLTSNINLLDNGKDINFINIVISFYMLILLIILGIYFFWLNDIVIEG
jgi:hypothetical protein